MEEAKDFLKYYVEPHYKVSRDVKDKDLKRVVEDSHIMFNLCFTKRGNFQGAFAIAHPQINKKDPLRFFVTKDKEIIINPVMIRHTEVAVFGMEGCLSWPDREMVNVPRYHKCEFEYYSLTPEYKLTGKLLRKLSGLDAKIFQHELDHLDAKFIYDYV